jgi:hypothetical protein
MIAGSSPYGSRPLPTHRRPYGRPRRPAGPAGCPGSGSGGGEQLCRRQAGGDLARGRADTGRPVGKTRLIREFLDTAQRKAGDQGLRVRAQVAKEATAYTEWLRMIDLGELGVASRGQAAATAHRLRLT